MEFLRRLSAFQKLLIGAGLLIVAILASTCVAMPALFAPTVINDLPSSVVVCEKRLGIRNKVSIAPGESSKVKSKDCAVVSPQGAYLGCLLVGRDFSRRISASRYNPDILATDCYIANRYGIQPQ